MNNQQRHKFGGWLELLIDGVDERLRLVVLTKVDNSPCYSQVVQWMLLIYCWAWLVMVVVSRGLLHYSEFERWCCACVSGSQQWRRGRDLGG
jgi:hypothetical protein